ncbi:ubiquitin-specific protease doa4 [Puttea exsequens]|nr:ubiquitin-specific protease doa4 [Puttea exsequens]
MTVKAPTNGPVLLPMSAYPPPPPRGGQSANYAPYTSLSSKENGFTAISGGPPRTSPYPHIKDLQERASSAVRNIDPHVPIRGLLNNAQQSMTQVGTDVSFRRPDRAYVEYLIGSDLLLNVIPKHKDFPSVIASKGEWQQIYQRLCKQSDTQHAMAKQLYEIIVDDNAKNGVKPSSFSASGSASSNFSNGQRQQSQARSRPLSMPDTPTSSKKQIDELFLPQTNGNSKPPPRDVSPIPRRDRPIVQAKPEGLRARKDMRDPSPRAGHGDELAERFSHHRVQRNNVALTKRSSLQGSSQSDSASMPSPTSVIQTPYGEPYTLGHESCPGSGGHPSPSKPSGPRQMLPPPPKYPPPPPKIPLDYRAEMQLPRAPSPAYNPSTSNIPPVRTNLPSLNRKPSIVGQDPSSPHSTKRFSVASQNSDYPQSIKSMQSNTNSPVRKSAPTPFRSARSISASELYDYLQKSNVLLIDVRSRQDYDEGHIFATSIICIEPVGLKTGLSAEELEDRLVMSPESEQNLFGRRDEFDLVVYYDQTTQSDKFLKGPPTGTNADALRALHDTLYEFNDYKPLRRLPVMLRGGLEEWIDLVGPQSLSISNTAAIVGRARTQTTTKKAGRPIGRVPKASANSSLEVRKRRLRDQKPLSADEQKTWLEKAQNEEVDPSEYQNSQSDVDSDSHGDEPPSPFITTYEDFLRKFPAPTTLQESMIGTGSPLPLRRPAPAPQIVPRSVPIPSIPSRPPPALPRPSYGGVSEQSLPASPLVRQQSSAQYPLYTSRSVSRNSKLPRTGLVNFGVTCYMNATIQCLLATLPMTHYFLDNRWRDHVQENWKGSNGIMPIHYANLIRSLWKDDVQAIRPKSFRDVCKRLNSEWGLDRQQDAKEFFDFVIDCLHEDLNLRWQGTQLKPLNESQEAQRERMPMQQVSKVEWDRYTHRETSYIADLFAGQHASRLRCTDCNNTSTTYEAFYSISVEIPRSAGSRRPWTIDDCLRSYCQEEKLSGDEVWKCPHCKCEREATKQITVTRAPPILVVHFKRFEMRKGENARKVHTPIDFPLFGLNLEPYMVDWRKQSQESNKFEGPIESATTPPFIYDAYAVMRHIGTSGNGGHYISLVRDAARANVWVKYDDDKASEFYPSKLKSDHRLQNEQAYLVFYGRAAAR